jgi:hypothetical protein
VLERHFRDVERAADVAEAFILVEEPLFADRLGLVVVSLARPGLGGPAFVAELTQRLSSIPIMVLGRGGESATLYAGSNVRFLPCATGSHEMLAVGRQMIEQYSPHPA